MLHFADLEKTLLVNLGDRDRDALARFLSFSSHFATLAGPETQLLSSIEHVWRTRQTPS